MSEVYLDRCPFCGDEASIYEPEPHIHGPDTGRKYCVRCASCDLLFGYDETYGGDFKTPEEAAYEWNMRDAR